MGDLDGGDDPGGQEQDTAEAAPPPAPQSQPGRKLKHMCIACGKNVTGASVQCRYILQSVVP
jgi:hypothetical protein